MEKNTGFFYMEKVLVFLGFYLVFGLTMAFSQSASFSSSLTGDQSCGGATIDFTIDDETGINTAKWEFGNGEPDRIDDPFTVNGTAVDASSTYITAGNYTITLTINEGEASEDIQTLDIDIFDAPSPTFTVSDGSNEGCLNPGLTVNFDYTANPTDIVEWVYNFGDGTTTTFTSAGGSNGDESHTYSAPGTYNVFLSVTDINGCTESVFEAALVTANSTPVADFSIGTPASCDLPIDVTFTDNSTDAEDNISFYTWTIVRDPGGDDETITIRSEQNPTVSFTEFDTYRVTLEVGTSPAECTHSTFQDFTLVENTVDFFPASTTNYCVNEPISFTDNSTDGSGTPSAYLWNFGDTNTSTLEDPTHSYTSDGTYDVSLTVTFSDGCQKTLIKEGVVVINPDLDASIGVDVDESCESYTANFTASPNSGVLYEWDFAYNGVTPNYTFSSASNTASNTYSLEGTYSIALRTTTADGCIEEVTESNLVQVIFPAPDFTVSTTEREGCVGDIANFDASSTVNTLPTGNEGIATYNWDFDNDGNEDAVGLTSPTTSHNYVAEGSYSVTLRVVTDAGCEMSITKTDYVKRGLKPTGGFTITQPDNCVKTDITFTSTSVANASSALPIDSIHWDFGDGNTTSADYASESTTTHAYQDDGTYTVEMTVFANGCAADVVSQNVVIDLPVARFSLDSDDFSCLDQGGTTITFDASGSEGVETYSWDFGDGNTDSGTGADPSTTHTYATNGDYSATLTVNNSTTSCSDEVSLEINVSTGSVDFSTTTLSDICYTTDDVTFTNNSTTTTSSMVTYDWDFGTDAIPATHTGATPPTVTYSSPGFKTISLTQTEEDGCVRTVTKTDYIEVEGPIADFNFTSSNSDNTIQCLEPTQSLSFTNNSTANGTGSSLMSWSWDFGAGASPATSTAENPGTVTYSTSGQKTIELTVTDNQGCSHTLSETALIRVPNPIAAFNTNDTEYCTGDNVIITNNSTETVLNSITSWSWDFGTGASPATSTAENPGAVTYSSTGTKTISLTVTTTAGCTNITTSDIDVYEANASFTAAETTLGCASALAEFTDTSVDIIAWEWDFGDQFGTTSTVQNPTHTYFYPGVYEVTLTTTSAGGCQETSATETITVDGPYYTTFTHGATGCLDNDVGTADFVELTFNVTGLVKTEQVQLDWGDGEPAYTQVGGADFSVTHQYTAVGTFTPKLTLTDDGTCGSYIYVSDEDVIVSQDPDPSFTSEVLVGDGCQDTQLQFFDQTQLAGGLLDSRYPITSWLWDFGDNDNTTSTDQNPVFTYDDEQGDITVTLTVSTDFGCSETASEIIHIEPGIIDLTTASSQTVCSGDTPAILDGDDNPTQGDEMTYTFLWETSTNQVDWTDASGTNTNPDYTPPATTPSVQTTTYYRRTTFSGPCEFISDPFTIITDPASDGGTLSTAATVCYNDNSGTLVLADEVGDIVKWQYSTDNFSSDINDIANTANTESYTSLTQTTYYRVEVKSGVCTPAYSNVIEITVLPEITGNVLASTLDACEGVDPGTITATAAAGSAGNFTYQWQESTDDVNFTDIGGETGDSYDPGIITSDIYIRRQVISDGLCEVFSNSMFIRVSPAADGGSGQTISALTATMNADVSGFVGSDAGTWSLVSKPGIVPAPADPTITTPSSESTTITGLVPGEYTFRWTVDNGTCSTTDDVVITVEPTIEISVASSPQAEDGGGNMTYTFTSNGALVSDLSINFDVSGDATLTDDYTESGSDSYSNTTGQITLSANTTTTTTTISPVDDTDIETDENLTMTITSGTGYVIGTNDDATGTITDDDDDNVVMVLTKDRDGEEEGPITLRYTITLHDGSSAGDVLTNQTGSDITCTITYSEGTAVLADFAALGTQNVAVTNGNSSRNRTRTVIDDNLIELTETISAQLSAASGPAGVTVSVDATSVDADVIDNDADDATLEIETVQDGIEGSDDIQYSVKLTDGAGTDLTNATGAAFTGTIGFTGSADLTDLTETSFPTTFSIADGDNNQLITFDPINDTQVEFESLTATISSPVANNGITPAIGVSNDVATIDDDAELEIALTQDGTEDADNLQYTVKITSAGLDATNATGGDITADIDFTGVAAADFVSALPTGITIGNGTGSTLVDLDVFDDLLVEGDETVNAALSSPTSGVTISGTAGDVNGQIIDNDDGAVVLVEILEEQDGAEGGANVQFRVNLVDAGDNDLVNATGSDITVDIMFTNVAAQADFSTTFPTEVDIPDGDGFVIVDLAVNDDLLIEEDEDITATISNPIGASLATSTSAIATVADNDDDNVHLKIVTIQDGVEGGDNVQYLVSLTDTNDDSGNTLTNATGSNFTANIGFTGATQADFGTTFPTTVTIADTESTETIDLDAITDTSFEDEDLTATLTGASHATVTVTVVLDSDDADIDDDAILILTATQDGAEELSVNAEFTATLRNTANTTDLTNDAGGNITATISFATGTDAEATDITGGLGDQTVTIPNDGSTNDVISLDVIDDALLEIDETITGTLSSGSGGFTIPGATDSDAAAVIDNDAATVTIGDGSADEGDGITMDVEISGAVEGDVVIDITFANVTTETGDFTNTSQQVTFSSGTTTTQQITVPTTEDVVFEGAETFTATVALNSGNSEVVATDSGTGTIDDDDPITVTIGDVSATEGDDLVFTVTLSNPSDENIDISYTTNDGTATTANSDYTDNDNTLTINAGDETGIITINTGDDDILEDDENITVELTSTSQGTISASDGSALGTIIDNDAASVTISDASETEGNDLTFTLTLDNDVEGDVVVDVTFTNVSTSNDDYVETTQTVTFTGGSSGTETITVGTTDDGVLEIDEEFAVSLSLGTGNANGEVDVSDTGEGEIVDNDAASVTISDASETEGNDLTFTLTLDNDVEGDVVVDVTFTNVSTSNDDYVETTQTVTFTGGSSGTETITVGTTDDGVLEIDEEFAVSLSLGTGNANGEVDVSDTGEGEIVDNDAASVTISDASETEGNDLTFTLTLDNDVEGDVVVDVTFTNVSTSNDDYVETTQTVTFTGGSSGTETITVGTTDDGVLEIDEEFAVSLSLGTGNANGEVDVSDTGEGEIVDNDAASVTISDASETEGNDLTFTLTLDNDVEGDVVVDVTFTNVSTSNDDYVETTQTVTFTGGSSGTETITVGTTDDGVLEIDEEFAVSLSLGTGNANGEVDVSDTGEGEIVDNDAASVTISDASETEGNDLTFTLTLDNDVEGDVVVDVTFTNVSTSNDDYVETTQTVTFTGGSSGTETITVGTTDDGVLEIDEEFAVSLSLGTGNANGEVDVSDTGEGEIVDNDAASVTISDASETEGNDLTFTLTLDNDVEGDVVVDVTFTNVSTSNDDYVETTQTVTFTGGSSGTETITVGTTDDGVLEIDEEFAVSLSLGTGNANGEVDVSDTGEGEIVDNDAASVTISDASETEGDDLTFTLTLDNDVEGDVVVDVTFTNVSTSNDDYVETTQTVTFTGGSSGTETITVGTTDDGVLEIDEAFAVSLSLGTGNANGEVDVSDTGEGEIIDNDAASVTISDASETEGNDLTFTLTLDNDVEGDVVVDVTFTNVSTSNDDYVETTQTVTFTGGSSGTETITVGTTDDGVLEIDEEFAVSLSLGTGNANGEVDVSDTGEGEIVDNDAASVTISDASETEGNDLTFTLTLDNDVEGDVVVDVTFTNVSTSNDDYVETTQTVTFTGGSSGTETITVGTTDDGVLEIDEEFAVSLSLGTGNANGEVDVSDTGEGEIVDNDAASVTISDASETEGNDLTFTLTLDNDVEGDVVVDVTFTNVSTSDDDYVETTQTVTFTGGSSGTETITVGTTDDGVLEIDEEFAVSLSLGTGNANGEVDVSDTGEGEIVDNDAASVTISDASETEGNDLTFTLTLDNDVEGDVVVDVTFTNVSTSDDDYVETTQTVTFTGGSSGTETITVGTTDDGVLEIDEEFAVSLSLGTGNVNGEVDVSDTGEGEIVDNDAASVTISDASETEGNDLTFTLTLDNDVEGDVVVDVTFTNVSTSDDDYVETTQTVTFTGGSSGTETITVGTTDDGVLEIDEEFAVSLSLGTGNVNGEVDVSDTGEGEIVDNDAASVTISDASETEGNDLTFTLTLDNDVEGDVVVDVTFTNVSTSNDDYVETTQTVTFTGGSSGTETITVGTTDDGVLEIDEAFAVSLSLGTGNVNGEVDVSDTGEGEIVDNDAASVTISDASETEGNDLTFTLTLDNDVEGDVVVDVTFTNVSTSDDDYVETTQTVTFAGGSSGTETITVGTTDDGVLEIDEEFAVSLSLGTGNVNGEVDVSDTGEGEIVDNDASSVTISDAVITEGGDLAFDLELTADVAGDVVIDVTFTNITTEDDDYDGLTQTFTFTGGSAGIQTVTVVTTDDLVLELDEELTASLSFGTGNVIATIDISDTGIGTIVDGDVANVTIDDASITEGGNIIFTLSLENDVDGDVVVDVSFIDLTAAPEDYQWATQTVTFVSGDAGSQTVTVGTTDDPELELDETFSANLALGTGNINSEVDVSDIGIGTIIENDVDLSVTKVVDNPTPNVASEVTFTITITNGGLIDATNVEVQDELPDGYTFVSDATSQGAYDSNTGIWSVGTIASTESATLTIIAMVNPAGDYLNIASVTVAEEDSDTDNNSDNATVDANPITDLIINKVIDNNIPDVGSEVVFTITVMNDGPSDATNVTVTDQLPTGYTYISDDGSGAYDSETGVWLVGALSNGASTELNITALVNAEGVYENVATVTGEEDDLDESDNSDSATSEPNDLADLVITKTVDASSPVSGDEITFTIQVINDGPSATTNAVVTDQLPDGYTYMSDNSGGTYDPETGIWVIGDMINGQLAVLEITVTVNQRGNYENVASVISDREDPDESNNTDTAEPIPSNVILETRIVMTPNGDGLNDDFIIDGIENYPNNSVIIFNRWGNEVWRIDGYENGNPNRSFLGNSNTGVINNTAGLPDGTYYYVIDLKDGGKPQKGFVTIKK